MKKFILVLVIALQASTVQAQELKQFLQNCAWGTLGGAAAGLASLAFTDKPNDSWSNVAKGASLGLYVGIGYGIYKINNPTPTTRQQPDFALTPDWSKEGQVQGFQLTGTVYRF